MTAPTGTALSAGENQFESQAVEVLRQLRAAFLDMLEHLPGPIHRAADLERALGISTTLAWQIHRVATSPNPLTAGADVPGRAAMRQAYRAARAKGLDEARLRAAQKALDAFESLVERHAGDRSTFATMINSLAGEHNDQIELKTRRQAFRVNSQVWGVQVKTMLTCILQHPGSKSSLRDYAVIRGLRDLRRLRAGAPFHLSGTRLYDSHQHSIEPHAARADAQSSPPGPNLLLKYCTRPYPELEHRLSDDGCYDNYLSDTPLGNAGLQTLFTSQLMRDVEWQKPAGTPNTYNHHQLISKPTETLVLDALFHHNMYGRLSPEVRVIGSLAWLGHAGKSRSLPEETLPMNVEIHNLGTGVSVLPTAHVSRYAEIVESVCRRLGWDPNRFEVFRCVIEYPLLGSMVHRRFPLPEKGHW